MEDSERKNVSKTLDQLNVYSFQPRRKLSLENMETGKKYQIISAHKTLKMNKSKKTVVKLEIDQYFIYLPQRFNRLSDDIWIHLNKGNFEICKIGQRNKTFHLIFSNCANGSNETVNFEIAEYLNIYKPNFYNENC